MIETFDSMSFSQRMYTLLRARYGDLTDGTVRELSEKSGINPVTLKQLVGLAPCSVVATRSRTIVSLGALAQASMDFLLAGEGHPVFPHPYTYDAIGISGNLAYLRRHAGLTTVDLGSDIGCTKQNIHRLESLKQNDSVILSTLLRLGTYYKQPPNVMLGLEVLS